MCMNVHTCARAHTYTHTHTHTHTLTQRACTTCSDIGSYFSHKVYMCMNVHACAHTRHTHTCTHTHTHTHTHTDWACTTCSDFGLLFLTLYSQSMYMCKNTLAHCYVNSPYTIIVTNTYTHTYTHTLTCAHTHAHAHTHLCTHIVMYTACTPYICHTYSTYTYSTLALLRKWNLVHNTYIHSCTVHLYARILMKNMKHVYTHSCTLHVRSILNLFLSRPLGYTARML